MSCFVGIGSGSYKEVKDIQVGVGGVAKNVNYVKRWDGAILWQRSSGLFVGVRTSDNTIYTSSDGLMWNNKVVSGYGSISSCCLLGEKIYFLSLNSSAAYLYSINSDLSGSIAQVKIFGTATKTGCVVPIGTKLFVSMCNNSTYSNFIYDILTDTTVDVDLDYMSPGVTDSKILFSHGVSNGEVILVYSTEFVGYSSYSSTVTSMKQDGTFAGTTRLTGEMVIPSICNGMALETKNGLTEETHTFGVLNVMQESSDLYDFYVGINRSPDGSRMCWFRNKYSILLHVPESEIDDRRMYQAETLGGVMSGLDESLPFSKDRKSIVSNGTVLLASNNGYMEYTLDGVTYVATSIPTIDVLEYYSV